MQYSTFNIDRKTTQTIKKRNKTREQYYKLTRRNKYL